MIKSLSKTAWLVVFCISLLACVGSPVEKKPEAVEQAYKSLSAGVTNYNNSNYSSAQLHFNNALKIFRSIDNREGTASSCLNIAKVHLERNETILAQDYLTIAEAIIKSSALDNLGEHLTITKSSLAITKQEFESAIKILDPLVASQKNDTIKLAALQNRIRIAFAQDDIDKAKSLTQIFAVAIQNTGLANTTYQARLLRFQAALSENRTDTTNAFMQALDIYRKHTHRPGIASTLHEWGDDLLGNNETDNAKEKFLRALYIRQTIKDKDGSLRILKSLDRAYIALGDTVKREQTEDWIKKLEKAAFNQWGKFTAAFNEYPTN